jgi:hypothetical protein
VALPVERRRQLVLLQRRPRRRRVAEGGGKGGRGVEGRGPQRARAHARCAPSRDARARVDDSGALRQRSGGAHAALRRAVRCSGLALPCEERGACDLMHLLLGACTASFMRPLFHTAMCVNKYASRDSHRKVHYGLQEVVDQELEFGNSISCELLLSKEFIYMSRGPGQTYMQRWRKFTPPSHK